MESEVSRGEVTENGCRAKEGKGSKLKIVIVWYIGYSCLPAPHPPPSRGVEGNLLEWYIKNVPGASESEAWKEESGTSKKRVRRGQNVLESRKEWKYSNRVEQSRAERRVTSAALSRQPALLALLALRRAEHVTSRTRTSATSVSPLSTRSSGDDQVLFALILEYVLICLQDTGKLNNCRSPKSMDVCNI